MIATGFFLSPSRLLDAYGSNKHAGWFYEVGRDSFNGILLCNQIIGVGLILGWVTVTMLPFFLWINYMGWFRSDALEEMIGLDLSYMSTKGCDVTVGSFGHQSSINDNGLSVKSITSSRRRQT